MLPLALFLTFQSETKYKFVTFVIVYWLLAGPTLNTELFIVNIESWYFDIQPARFIFIAFTVYLITLLGTQRRIRIRENARDNEEIPNAVGNPVFEKFLYIFLALYLLANIIHTGDVLTMREIAASYTNLLVFPVIYLVLKKTADSGMIKTIFRALLVVCILSSIVGIYQFFVDPDFLRWGFKLGAFAGFKRANGIYWAEYLQGSFLLTGIVTALIIVKSTIKKTLLILLMLTGIVLTFHRATWIITLLVFIIYFVVIKRIKLWQFIALCVVSALVIRMFLDIDTSFSQTFRDSSFVNERLSTDTWTDRIMLYNMALQRIPKYFFFGVGSPKSEVYMHGVMEIGGEIEVAMGEIGGIHNLYLLTAFFHGVPAALFLLLFCITCLIYFLKKMKPKYAIYTIPFATIFIYFLQNMLNTFFLHHEFSLLLAICCGIGVAAYKNDMKLLYFHDNLEHN